MLFVHGGERKVGDVRLGANHVILIHILRERHTGTEKQHYKQQ
jgi:hypothetical protein